MAGARADLFAYHDKKQERAPAERFKSAILNACGKGNLDLIRSLLQAGADPNSCSWVSL